jgi:hypothetical protein
LRIWFLAQFLWYFGFFCFRPKSKHHRLLKFSKKLKFGGPYCTYCSRAANASKLGGAHFGILRIFISYKWIWIGERIRRPSTKAYLFFSFYAEMSFVAKKEKKSQNSVTNGSTWEYTKKSEILCWFQIWKIAVETKCTQKSFDRKTV